MNGDILLMWLAVYVPATFLITYFTARWAESGKQDAVLKRIEALTSTVETIKSDIALSGVVKKTLYDESRIIAIEAYLRLHKIHRYCMDAKQINPFSVTMDQVQDTINGLNKVYDDFVETMGKAEIFLQRTPALDCLAKCSQDLGLLALHIKGLHFNSGMKAGSYSAYEKFRADAEKAGEVGKEAIYARAVGDLQNDAIKTVEHFHKYIKEAEDKIDKSVEALKVEVLRVIEQPDYFVDNRRAV